MSRPVPLNVKHQTGGKLSSDIEVTPPGEPLSALMPVSREANPLIMNDDTLTPSPLLEPQKEAQSNCQIPKDGTLEEHLQKGDSTESLANRERGNLEHGSKAIANAAAKAVIQQ